MKKTVVSLVVLGILIFGVIFITSGKSLSLQGVQWKLEYFVINGVKTTEHVGEQWLEFKGKTWTGFDNCNEIIGEYKISNVNKLEMSQELRTLEACHVVNTTTGEILSIGDKEFHEPLLQVKTFEIKDGYLWLYFSDDKQNALVFSPVP